MWLLQWKPNATSLEVLSDKCSKLMQNLAIVPSINNQIDDRNGAGNWHGYPGRSKAYEPMVPVKSQWFVFSAD